MIHRAGGRRVAREYTHTFARVPVQCRPVRFPLGTWCARGAVGSVLLQNARAVALCGTVPPVATGNGVDATRFQRANMQRLNTLATVDAARPKTDRRLPLEELNSHHEAPCRPSRNSPLFQDRRRNTGPIPSRSGNRASSAIELEVPARLPPARPACSTSLRPMSDRFSAGR